LRTKRSYPKRGLKNKCLHLWDKQNLNHNNLQIHSCLARTKTFPHECHFPTESLSLSDNVRRCGRSMPCEPLRVPMAISSVTSGITTANLKYVDMQKGAKREMETWRILINSIQISPLTPGRGYAPAAQMRIRTETRISIAYREGPFLAVLTLLVSLGLDDGQRLRRQLGRRHALVCPRAINVKQILSLRSERRRLS
jgi:hypothetical protein